MNIPHLWEFSLWIVWAYIVWVKWERSGRGDGHEGWGDGRFPGWGYTMVEVRVRCPSSWWDSAVGWGQLLQLSSSSSQDCLLDLSIFLINQGVTLLYMFSDTIPAIILYCLSVLCKSGLCVESIVHHLGQGCPQAIQYLEIVPHPGDRREDSSSLPGTRHHVTRYILMTPEGTWRPNLQSTDSMTKWWQEWHNWTSTDIKFLSKTQLLITTQLPDASTQRSLSTAYRMRIQDPVSSWQKPSGRNVLEMSFH